MALSYKVELRALQLKSCDIFWQAFDASFDDAVRKAEEPYQQLMTAAATAGEKVRPNAKELLTMQAFEENLKLFTNSVNSAGYVVPNHFIDHYFGYFCSESSKLTGLPQEIGWIYVRSKYAQKGNLLEFLETDYTIDCRTWFYNTFQLAALKILDNPTLFDKSGPKMEIMRNIEETKRRVIEPSIFDGICMSLDWTKILQIPTGLISLPRGHPSALRLPQQPLPPQQSYQAAYPSRVNPTPTPAPLQSYQQPQYPQAQQYPQQPPQSLQSSASQYLQQPPQQSTASQYLQQPPPQPQPQPLQPSIPSYPQQYQPSPPPQPASSYQHTATDLSDTGSAGNGSATGATSASVTMKQEMERMKDELIRANEEKIAGIQRQFGTELENVKREMIAKQQANNTLNERLDESARKVKQFQQYYVQQAEEARQQQQQQQAIRMQPTIMPASAPTSTPITSAFSTSYYPPPQQQQQSSGQNSPSLSSSLSTTYNSLPRLSSSSSSISGSISGSVPSSSLPVMPPTPKAATTSSDGSSSSGLSKPFNFDEHGLLDQHFTSSRPQQQSQQSQQSQPQQVSLLTSTVPLPTPAPFHHSHVEYANDEYGALRGQQAYESEHEEATRPLSSSSSLSSSTKEPEKKN